MPVTHAPVATADLEQRLSCAGDDRLTQVVALVDSMEVRGAADALIQPLRARLAVLAPARPIQIGRLIFKPLDGVIEPGPQWRPGSVAVPRSALGLIGGLLMTEIADVVDRVRPRASGHLWSDTVVVTEVGAQLWPAAAKALSAMAIPAGWIETGLPEACFDPIRHSIAAVLDQGVLLDSWPHTLPDDDDLHACVGEILTRARERHPAGVGTVISVLLSNPAVADTVLAVIASLPGGDAEAAIEHTLRKATHTFASVLPTVSLAAACSQAVQAAALLETIDSPTTLARFRDHALDCRGLAETACRNRMVQALEQQILPALTASGDALDDAGADRLEAATRDIRRLGLIGRRFGTSATFDKVLNRTAEGICAAQTTTLSTIDRLRLAELLVGADTALELMADRPE